MITNRICPKCNNEVRFDDSKEFMFCNYCGEKIKKESNAIKIKKKCSACNEMVEIDPSRETAFCNYCGGKIEISSEERSLLGQFNIRTKGEDIYHDFSPKTNTNRNDTERDMQEGTKRQGPLGIIAFVSALLVVLSPIAIILSIIELTTAKKRKKIGLAIAGLVIGLVCCIVMGIVIGERGINCLFGHTWVEATCNKLEHCEICGKERGEFKEHTWIEATCTDAKFCKVCYVKDGEPLGHSLIPATCTSRAICRVCGIQTGFTKDHDVKNYKCVDCGITIISRTDVANILDITELKYEMDYLGGITQYINVTNKSSTKTIKYITYKFKFLNSVGDVLPDQLGFFDYASLQYTGPLEPGKSSGKKTWAGCFYNSSFCGTMRIDEIKIEYTDGTTLVLDDSVAWYAVVNWR